jgi:hypothetical protein
LDTSVIALHLAQRYQNVLNTIDDAVVEGKIRAYVSEDLNESYDSVLNIQHYSYKISSGNVDSKVGYIHDAVVLDNVKSNRRNFHKALVVYQQVHIKEGVQLNFKALGMGSVPIVLEEDIRTMPEAEYYVSPIDVSKVLSSEDDKFFRLVMQHAYKSKNEQNKNWSLKSDIVYGNIDFPLMARLGFMIQSDMSDVYDSMLVHMFLPNTFVEYNSERFHKDSFTFVLGESTNAMLDRNKDNRKAKIDAQPRLLRFKKSKEVIALGWKLEGKLVYTNRNAVIIFPMEEAHFITKDEILKFAPNAAIWFDLIFQ